MWHDCVVSTTYGWRRGEDEREWQSSVLDASVGELT